MLNRNRVWMLLRWAAASVALCLLAATLGGEVLRASEPVDEEAPEMDCSMTTELSLSGQGNASHTFDMQRNRAWTLLRARDRTADETQWPGVSVQMFLHAPNGAYRMQAVTVQSETADVVWHWAPLVTHSFSDHDRAHLTSTDYGPMAKGKVLLRVVASDDEEWQLWLHSYGCNFVEE